MSKENITITTAKSFKINKKSKYLLVFKSNKKDNRDLTQLNEALKNLFGDGQVLALFHDEFTELKVYELTQEDGN